MLHGEGVVLRVLDKSAAMFKLELGMDDTTIAVGCCHQTPRHLAGDGPHWLEINDALRLAGSHRDRRDQIITVEDPVERHVEGVNQIRCTAAWGSTSLRLRAILRHDPDVVMIGKSATAKPPKPRSKHRSPDTWSSRPCTNSAVGAPRCWTWASSHLVASSLKPSWPATGSRLCPPAATSQPEAPFEAGGAENAAIPATGGHGVYELLRSMRTFTHIMAWPGWGPGRRSRPKGHALGRARPAAGAAGTPRPPRSRVTAGCSALEGARTPLLGGSAVVFSCHQMQRKFFLIPTPWSPTGTLLHRLRSP